MTQKSGDFIRAQTGEFNQRRLEKRALTGEQCAQHKTGGELFRTPQMRDEIAQANIGVIGGVIGQNDIGAVARFTKRQRGARFAQPAALQNQRLQTTRCGRDQFAAHGRRQASSG